MLQADGACVDVVVAVVRQLYERRFIDEKEWAKLESKCGAQETLAEFLASLDSRTSHLSAGLPTMLQHHLSAVPRRTHGAHVRTARRSAVIGSVIAHSVTLNTAVAPTPAPSAGESFSEIQLLRAELAELKRLLQRGNNSQHADAQSAEP
jgi:hypothetical protein